MEGPVNSKAFAFLMECVRRGGDMSPFETVDWLPDLDSKLDASRLSDYYLLPGQIRAQLTKLVLSVWTSPEVAAEPVDASKLGLCRSEMILERLHLESLHISGLRLENSHVKRIFFTRCRLVDCDFAQSVTAREAQISSSRLERVQLGVFATKISVEDRSELLCCNIRVVEELVVRNSRLHNCTFQGSDEDRKDRQVVSAVFDASEIHGDVSLPFDKILCEQTYFHGNRLQMTKGGASITLAKTRITSLPSMDGDTHVHLCLEDCSLLEAITFNRMKLQLKNVRFHKPCEFAEVVFFEKVCDIAFPRKSVFRCVRFKEGLHACIASGCSFEGCNLGYGQDAISDCLLTQCSFRACRFPFLEPDSPVANLAGCNFVACKIQWSGQFPHEESFVINSCWLRKWNLAASTVSDGT